MREHPNKISRPSRRLTVWMLIATAVSLLVVALVYVLAVYQIEENAQSEEEALGIGYPADSLGHDNNSGIYLDAVEMGGYLANFTHSRQVEHRLISCSSNPLIKDLRQGGPEEDGGTNDSYSIHTNLEWTREIYERLPRARAYTREIYACLGAVADSAPQLGSAPVH